MELSQNSWKWSNQKIFPFIKLKFQTVMLHYILIEYYCFILTVLLQKIIFVSWNGNGIARLPGMLKSFVIHLL